MTAEGNNTNARDAAVGIVRRLRRAGHVTYLAGGCVRDRLLGVEPKDFDVATEARPEVVRGLFKRSQYVGEAFGVVLVYTGHGRDAGPGVEVATFRTEWGYEDGRRPGGVEFTDAEHDAQRRDFTVNGLFADPLDDELEPVAPGREKVIDYVGGVADLKAKVLRAIGDPRDRFQEDYLRMLRAARFAARLGFEIDPDTHQAIRQLSQGLKQISRERIGQEIKQMLTGPNPVRAAGLIQSLAIDGPALEHGHRDVPLTALGKLHQATTPTYALSLAAWMLDRNQASGSLEAAAELVRSELDGSLVVWRRALNLSNQDRDELKRVLALLPTVHRWPDLRTSKRMRLLASEAWPGAHELLRAIGPEDVVERIQAEALPLQMVGVSPARLVNGDDLISMGVTGGPRIGELLEGVYDAQLEGRVKDREAGLAWVRRHM